MPEEIVAELYDVLAALRPEDGTAERAGEYGRLLAERDRLIADGVDPAELLIPDKPDDTRRG